MSRWFPTASPLLWLTSLDLGNQSSKVLSMAFLLVFFEIGADF